MNFFTMFRKQSTGTISKPWLLNPKFFQNFVSSHEKFVNDFIHLNWSFQLLLKLLNTTYQSSWFLINLDFFLPQIAYFNKSINLFCLVFLTLGFSFAVFFFFFFTTGTIRFHRFYTIYFVAYCRFLISSYILLFSLNILLLKQIHH